MTRRLEEVAKIVGIDILDHIIVTKNSFKSLRAEHLM